MDEVKFENRYTEDKKIVREFHKYILCRTQRRIGLICIVIAIASALFMLIGMTGMISISDSKAPIFWEVSVICMILGVILNLYYRMTAMIAMAQDRKNMEGNIPETIIQFSDEDVVISELGKVKTFHYRELGELQETRNLFVLMIAKYAAIVAVKDKFSYGDPDSFRKFIKEKYDPEYKM